jgi:D-glycero-beta-D-manno-heptose-7-phosphate kinase
MNSLLEILKKFKGRKITVIGDVMLDEYIQGPVPGMSPEAPVPILKVKERIYRLGGAANVASSIATLGGNVSLFGFKGEDSSGNELKKLLEQDAINYYLETRFKTTTKTRLVGMHNGGLHQLYRLDYEETSPKVFGDEIKRNLLREAIDSEVIVISDYAKGTITPDLMCFLGNHRKKIIVDPKQKTQDLYKGVLLVKPNEKEALEMAGEEDVYVAGRKLRENLDANILVTLGEQGMILFSDKEFKIPTFAQKISDVTGAGDTVISSIALAIAAGANLKKAANIANYAASIAVSKFGTHAVTFGELEARLLSCN